jgi:hypothetical protein
MQYAPASTLPNNSVGHYFNEVDAEKKSGQNYRVAGTGLNAILFLKERMPST